MSMATPRLTQYRAVCSGAMASSTELTYVCLLAVLYTGHSYVYHTTLHRLGKYMTATV